MKKNISSETTGVFLKYARKIAYLVIFLVIWQLLVLVFKIKPYILPSPVKTLSHLLNPEIAGKYHWFRNVQATLIEIFASFVISATTGIILAIIIVWSRLMKSILTPIIIFLNSLPKIALAPLFLLWFGYGILPNILIAVIISFFPIVINTVTGLNAVDDDLLDLVRYLNASKLQLFIKIRIPNSLPYIFSGFKISATLCVVGSIVGEFVASDRGLGYLLKDAQAFIDTPTMFASLIVISVMGFLFFSMITFLERIFMPWQSADGEGAE